MELTQEQKDIIGTLDTDEKIIKINAFAGCGKTSTVIELVKKIRETDKDSKILYVVFNRSMLEEAKVKFSGLDVECQTTHGFALKRFSALKDGEVEVYPTLDFNTFMYLKNTKKYEKSWVRFKVINELLNAYCLTYDDMETFLTEVKKSTKKYTSIQTDRISFTELDFFKELYDYMIKNNMYTHGMYLKSYACECGDKITSYKYVLLDECQDTNAMFYCILRRMVYDKLYAVGDFFQTIYQFTHTVNIFDKLDGNTYPLSVSFRINDMECDLANKVLSHHYDNFAGDIKNLQNRTKIEDTTKKTILFRLNSTLFTYAVDLISKLDNIKVHFMDANSNGNSDGFDACFNDMLYFYYKLIECDDCDKAEVFKKNFNFKSCKLVDNFIKVCKKENTNLYNYLCRNKSVLPLDFLKYFNFFILNEVNIIDVVNKVKHSEECENPTKEYFMSTVHRFKGLEAEHVSIPKDEWSLKTDAEANLCYVAVTRATKRLDAQPIIDLLD